MQKRALKSLSLALLGSTVMVSAAAAQDTDQVMAVYDRYRPDLSAEGIRSGGFLFRPTIAAEGKFDSNIYADNANEVDDFIAIIKPSFRMDSNWNNNSLSFYADAAIGKYSDSGDEDYEDFKVGSYGRLDISRGSNIFYDLSFSKEHEDRGSADNQSQLAPTEYDVLKAVVGFERDEGIVSLAIDGSYEKRDFDDVGTAGQAGFLDNDSRDRDTLKGSVRVGYELNPEYEAFVKFTAVKVEYDLSRTAGNTLRDSDGWDVVGGLAMNITGKTEGEFYVGYVKRDWDNIGFNDVSDFKFGASILWSGDITSARIGVNRDVTETSVAVGGLPAAGIVTTNYSLRLEHELRRNLLLNADTSFTKMNYTEAAGATGTRTDDVFSIGAGMRYLWNRNLSLNADYKYGERAAGVPFFDYDRHSFIVSLSAQW